MHLTFAADELPGRYRDVAASVGLLEKWYKFEEAALDSATRVLRRERHSDCGGIKPGIGLTRKDGTGNQLRRRCSQNEISRDARVLPLGNLLSRARWCNELR
jgi:hypothetical protein